MAWEVVADFILKEVKQRMASPQRRKDALGGFKRNTYRLDDTGSLSDSLSMEVIQLGEDRVQLALTYPNTKPNNIKAKIFFETGRKPGKGIRIDTQSPESNDIYGLASRKLPGFLTLSRKEQVFRLIRISMAIKNKGIGTYPIFDPSFISSVEQEYERWWNTLSDQEIEQLPGLQQVFEAIRNIKPFDEATISIFR